VRLRDIGRRRRIEQRIGRRFCRFKTRGPREASRRGARARLVDVGAAHVPEAAQRGGGHLVRVVGEAPLDAREQERLRGGDAHEPRHRGDALEKRDAQPPRAVVQAGDQQGHQEIVRVRAAEKRRERVRARQNGGARRRAGVARVPADGAAGAAERAGRRRAESARR